MLHRFIQLATFWASIVFIYSYKPGVPDGVLSESKMEKVLYDYHLAQGMAMQHAPDSINYFTRYYQQAVYTKYDIDQATFDRSMEWYARHTDKLSDIYKRLAEESGNVDQTSPTFLAAGTQSASGDSLNIWNNSNYTLLSSKGKNRFLFSEKADTAFKANDRLIWKFKVDWIYHEGAKQAEALLAIEYDNDSIDVRTFDIYSSGTQTLVMNIGQQKVKRVSGFIYQNAPWTERPRLLHLYDFQLLRIRERTEEPKATDKPTNSVNTDSATSSRTTNEETPRQRLRDSLHRADTLRELRPHFR